MRRLLLLGLNHTTAPLEVREKLAFDAGARLAALSAFAQRFPGSEAVLLSTCNRVELYVVRAAHAQLDVERMIEFLAELRGVAAGAFADSLYQKAEKAVAEHLFSVAASLDSMVLGETQILGQVREAYECAQQLSLAGPTLHPLFQRALMVGKQVMRQTPLAEGRVSVASVAVDHARRIFERFDDKTILSIGAGKMAGIMLQHLAGLGPKQLLVCNRDPVRAKALVDRLAAPFATSAAFEELPHHLIAADIVVCSTGASQPILTRSMFESIRKQRRYRPIFLIDIAVPRDISADVGELDNVYLYNLDDLQQVVLGTHSQRQEAMAAARAIVAREVEEYLVWHRQRELGPAIHRLYRRYHELAQEELGRELAKLPNIAAEEKAHLEEFARRLVNKLLHDPVQVLRQSRDAHVPAGPYLHALEKLFNLDGEAPPPASSPPADAIEPEDPA
jgi:glutamyl-tRNA reductase